MSNAVMNLLKADVLLSDSFVLTQVENLKAALNYRTDDIVVSFDDHFIFLQNSIDQIPRIKLLDSVSKGIAAKYENELLTALAEIQDAIEKWKIKVIRFQGGVMRAKSDSDELRSAFESWYYLAALEVLQAADIKLPATNIKNLATSEYSRLMNRTDVSLDALIEALKIEVKRLDGKRAMAKTMFDMGRDQANTSWANLLPNALGISGTGPELGVLSSAVDEDEMEGDEISFLSRKGGVQSSTYEDMPPTGTWCAVCHAAQFECPGGVGCPNGHGGADQLETKPVEIADEVLASGFVAESIKQVNLDDWTDEDRAAAEPKIEAEKAVDRADEAVGSGDVAVSDPQEIKGTFVKTGTPQPATILDDLEDAGDDEAGDETEDEATEEDGYHIELDPEADNAPDLTDVTDNELEYMEDQLLAEAEATVVEKLFQPTEVSIIPEEHVIDPHAKILDTVVVPQPERINTVVLEDDDLETPESSPVKEEVVVPQAVVETPKPTPTPAPTPAAPASTRKPLNFDFDDDEL